jgi:enoyl-CoA hydratase/carnithine racemase
MIELERQGDVFILRMDAGENRFAPDVVGEINARLDEVEKAEGPKALVTTGSGKFYSNGLDLDYVMGEDADPGRYIASVLGTISRVLTFPCVTVAAVNGHAFGAGALIAVAHDFRFMRADRGYFCMPEIDLKMPLHPGMTAVLKARLPSLVSHEVIATGHRFGGVEAAAKGIVGEACSEADVLPRAVQQAAELAGKADPVMSKLKLGLHREVVEALTLDVSSVPR